MNCLICQNKSNFLFKGNILNKYDVSYFQCGFCNFIQTEKPYWLNEAYKEAISSLDFGVVQRNNFFSGVTEQLIKKYFDNNGKFLDYGGGYGLFSRLMRDKEFDFYNYDLYCQNIFARDFAISDLSAEINFEMITAFEVFEHLLNPLETIKTLFKYSDSVLFSTDLVPEKALNKTGDWWYFVPESGQHISFFSIKSLEIIAREVNCNIYSNGTNLFLLTRKSIKNFSELKREHLLYRIFQAVINEIYPPGDYAVPVGGSKFFNFPLSAVDTQIKKKSFIYRVIYKLFRLLKSNT
jgi:hypothetical protein